MAEVNRVQEPVKKAAGCPYREPTQVPLAEEAQACRVNPAKGIRQISPVTSG
jgi:hypothetical protein